MKWMIEKIMVGMFIALVVGSAVYTLWRFARRPKDGKQFTDGQRMAMGMQNVNSRRKR